MAKHFKHGNSFDNDEPHHLYVVHDKTTDDVFKYGISYGPIGRDGISKRIREQLNFLNLAVGWNRHFALVLQKNIPGRKTAREMEDAHIADFEKTHGVRPRGNRKRGQPLF